MTSGCAWIHGEPCGADTVFCERPVHRRGSAWCAYHLGVVYERLQLDDAPADDGEAVAAE